MFKSKIVLISFLPSMILILILLLLISSSGQLATVENNAAQLGSKTGALGLFLRLKNPLYGGYIINYLLQTLKYYHQKDFRKKTINLLVYTLIGMVLVTFSFLIAALTYDLISVFLLAVTDPNYFKNSHT